MSQLRRGPFSPSSAPNQHKLAEPAQTRPTRGKQALLVFDLAALLVTTAYSAGKLYVTGFNFGLKWGARGQPSPGWVKRGVRERSWDTSRIPQSKNKQKNKNTTQHTPGWLLTDSLSKCYILSIISNIKCFRSHLGSSRCSPRLTFAWTSPHLLSTRQLRRGHFH